MNINKLILFVHLAKNKSFSATANEFFMTQPAVSQNIHSLEKELGVKLITRKTNGVEFTDAGKRLIPYACDLVEKYNQLIEESKKIMEQPRVLKVLYTGKLEKEIIAKAISLDKNNKLEIELFYGMYSEAEERLEKGEADLVFAISTAFSKKWNAVSLLKTPIKVITKKGCFNKTTVSLDELKRNKIAILDSQSSGLAGKEFRKGLIKLGFDESNFIPTDSIESQMLLVESGKAVTMMPFVNNEYTNADVCSLEGDPVYIETICVFKEENESIKYFINCCKKVISEM